MLVVPFSKRLGPVTGPTSDRATITEAVAHIEPRGGTAILDSLAEASRLIAPLEGRHVIVLVTDGYDEASTLSYEEALKDVQASGSTVFPIGVAGVAGVSTRGERMMKQLAAATGGRAFFPWRETELPVVHDRIASDVSKRYLITYTPTNQRIDGTWRPIELRTAEPSHKVRTKPGYFAPKPPPVRPVLEFTVTNADRSYLSVSRDDLTVVEDGVTQAIDTFQEVTTPVSIVMVVDQSGSMKKAAEKAVAAAKSFVSALRPEDALAILRFADSTVLAQDLSTNRNASLAALDEYTAKGGTALYDAVDAALTRLQRVEGRRVVVVFTDGRDENNAGNGPGSTIALNDLMGDLRESACSSSRSGWARTSTARCSNGSPAIRAARRIFPRPPTTWPATTRASSRTCGGATPSATRRRTRHATARGGRCRLGCPGQRRRWRAAAGIRPGAIVDRRDELFGSGIVRRSCRADFRSRQRRADDDDHARHRAGRLHHPLRGAGRVRCRRQRLRPRYRETGIALTRSR